MADAKAAVKTVEVEGQKYSPEEIKAALATMAKIREQREKAKTRVKEMTPEQKVALQKKYAIARAKNQLILLLAAKAGINPTDAEVAAFMAKKVA